MGEGCLRSDWPSEPDSIARTSVMSNGVRSTLLFTTSLESPKPWKWIPQTLSPGFGPKGAPPHYPREIGSRRLRLLACAGSWSMTRTSPRFSLG